MKHYFITINFLLLLVASACQPASPSCPPRSISYISDITQFTLSSSIDRPPSPGQVDINGKSIEVDDIVHGPLCSNDWQGTIYVACDLQIIAWQDDPLFLKDCDLSIEPGTVVYVAAHNDAPYYKGCACHTGEESQ